MKITQSWKRNTPTTDGYSLTVTYVYSSKYQHEIDEIEKKLPSGMIIMDTDYNTLKGENNTLNHVGAVFVHDG